MAQNEALIPYPSSREIVLRREGPVVVYDPASEQLVIRNAPPQRGESSDIELRDCPYCKRPLHDQSHDAAASSSSAAPAHGASSISASATYASPEYFQMLHHGLPGSAEPSSPPSPHRRVAQLLDSTPRPPPPPAGAEFVGSSPAPPSEQQGISSAAFSQGYFKRFFVEEQELGRGGKGVVLLVKHVLDGVSLGHFALKRIPVGDDHEWLAKVLVEVQLLQHLSHQNLVSYRHVWLEDVQITAFGPSVPCAFVLQQYCNKGDLHDYMYRGLKVQTSKDELKRRMRRRSRHEAEPPDKPDGPRKLHFEEIYGFFKDIASGLNHLHVNNYIHRDLKPNNCLLHDTGKELRVLVSDFGEVQSENQVRNSTGATGTVSYCAPEVLRRDPTTGHLGNFTTKSDIFSLGMILYFLCFASLPYRNADNLNEENEDFDLLRNEIAGWAGLQDMRSVRPDLPDPLYRFLRRLLSLDPLSRPSAEDILQQIKTGKDPEDLKAQQDEQHHHHHHAQSFRGRVGSDSRGRPSLASSTSLSPPRNPKSRISAVDTPQSHTPPPPLSSTARIPSTQHQHQQQRKPLRISPSRFIPAKRALRTREVSSSDDAVDDNDNDDNDDDDDIDDNNNENADLVEQNEPPTPSGSLVLRSPRAGPGLDFAEKTGDAQGPSRPPVGREFARRARVALFLAKIVAIYTPCLPLAAKPSVGLPLLGLATLDLVLSESSGALASVALLVGFVVALGAASRNDALCLRKVGVWEDF